MFFCSTHAEADLLRKMGDKIKNCKVAIYRFNNTRAHDARQPKCAKPCPLCQDMLRKSGVQKVFYMNDVGEVEMMRNKEMIEMIGCPTKITKYFLIRFGNECHGKFHAMNFVSA